MRGTEEARRATAAAVGAALRGLEATRASILGVHGKRGEEAYDEVRADLLRRIDALDAGSKVVEIKEWKR